MNRHFSRLGVIQVINKPATLDPKNPISFVFSFMYHMILQLSGMQDKYEKPMRWRLSRTLIYSDKKNDINIRVPRGFITDFATIPVVFRFLTPTIGPYAKASVLHDWMCENPDIWTWKESANIFLRAMQLEGVSYNKRYAIYWAVRLYGWFKMK